MSNPFRYFETSPGVIRLAVMMYVRFPLSLRQVEDLLHERGIEISNETVCARWNRFGPIFAAEVRKRRVAAHRNWIQWRWHLDEVFVRINGEVHYLWRAVDHEGEVLQGFLIRQSLRDQRSLFIPVSSDTAAEVQSETPMQSTRSQFLNVTSPSRVDTGEQEVAHSNLVGI